jgi:RND family efflux transporter MFP subunit
MKRRIIIPVAVSIIIIALIIWKLSANKKEMEKKLEQSIIVNTTIPVLIEKPELLKLENKLSLNGSIIPGNETLILSKAQGTIIRKYKKMGDSVKKGDVIVQIENEVLKKALIIARADYEKKAKDVQRYESLQKKGAVAQQEVETSLISLRESEGRITDLQDQIARTTITAPSSGIISKDFVENGQWVTTGSEMAHIFAGNALKLQGSVTEADMLKINKGQHVKVRFSSINDENFSGVVDRIAPKANELHFYAVEIVLKSKDDRLKPGMYATALIESSITAMPTITINRKSVVGGMKSPAVFIIKKGKAYKKYITTGYYNDEKIEVTSGISLKDTVIKSGHINLTDGMAVSILKRL